MANSWAPCLPSRSCDGSPLLARAETRNRPGEHEQEQRTDHRARLALHLALRLALRLELPEQVGCVLGAGHPEMLTAFAGAGLPQHP